MFLGEPKENIEKKRFKLSYRKINKIELFPILDTQEWKKNELNVVNQMVGFYMKCSSGLKWIQIVLLGRSMLRNAVKQFFDKETFNIQQASWIMFKFDNKDINQNNVIDAILLPFLLPLNIFCTRLLLFYCCLLACIYLLSVWKNVQT